MLSLVLAHGHQGGSVGEDVCSHEHGVGVKGETGVLVAAALFLLELDHFVKPAEGSQAGEEPHEFGVGLDV